MSALKYPLRRASLAILAGIVLAAVALAASTTPSGLDQQAQQYLVLELAMGKHDPAHVDAYFGPEELEKAAEASQWSLDEIIGRAEALSSQLATQKLGELSSLEAERIKGLQERIRALVTRAHMAQGTYYSFDEESRRLFGTMAPHNDPAHFQAILDQVDALVPGEGDLGTRVNAFREQFVIPLDRLAEVFDAAIAECRRRTAEHMDLPNPESFRTEYVTDKPWSGYNWYEGNAHSLIQVNTEFPIYISRAVDLGCHEGYPGHHVYNALLEKELVNDRGWVEYSLYPLFSPQSLIAEGSANHGINMVFSTEERIAFEKDVLFPLAGLDASKADDYYQLFELTGQLSFAGNEAARAYLDGDMDAEQARDWLMRYTLASEEKATQRVRFIDTYRSYVINYNLGKDIVQRWVERGDPTPEERWQRFSALLSSSMSAFDLLADLEEAK